MDLGKLGTWEGSRGYRLCVISALARVRFGSIESLRTVQPGSSVGSCSINTYAQHMHNIDILCVRIYIYIYIDAIHHLG
jgi:hypothetical protein